VSIYCAEVLSPDPDRDVKILLISQKPDGFFLERFNDRRELVGTTRHDEMDEAMRQAYSEYGAVSDWRLCPDDADPLAIRLLIGREAPASDTCTARQWPRSARASPCCA
jgi:hypothetical protein